MDSETKDKSVPQVLAVAKELKQKELTMTTELSDEDLLLIFSNTTEFANNKKFREFFYGSASINMSTSSAIDASVKAKIDKFELPAQKVEEDRRKKNFAAKTAKFGG